MPLCFSLYLIEKTQDHGVSISHLVVKAGPLTGCTDGLRWQSRKGPWWTLPSHHEKRPWYISGGRDHQVFAEWVTESVNLWTKWLLPTFYGNENILMWEKNILESVNMEKQQFYQHHKPTGNAPWTFFRITMNYWLQIIYKSFMVAFRWIK